MNDSGHTFNQIADHIEGKSLMKPEVKVTWLTALKSGEYKKGKMKLRNNVDDDEEYTYCCLGVLCEEYRKATGLGTWEGDIFIDGNERAT
jgi:hypothetical protein